MLAWLGIPLSPQGAEPLKSSVRPERKAEGHLTDTLTGTSFELQCVFPRTSDDGTEVREPPTLVSYKQLPVGVQPAITLEELDETEKVVCEDPTVIALCEEVGVSREQIRADCWSIGYEDRFGEGRRLQQAFVYARLKDHEHLYAHPLDFNVVVECVSRFPFGSSRVSSTDAPAASQHEHERDPKNRLCVPPSSRQREIVWYGVDSPSLGRG